MATYKVPQDVEAEDKLLGPFTFRQFIYLMVIFGLVLMAIGLFQLFPLLAIIPVPFIIFLGVLALPIKKDQPMETYLAAVLQYHTKPNKRFWIPGQSESTILITAPKKKEPSRKRNITEDEASHRLSFLSELVDSEGHAIKNSSNTMKDDFYAEAYNTADMFERDSNFGFGDKIAEQEQAHRAEVISQMRTAIQNSEYNYDNPANSQTTAPTIAGEHVIEPLHPTPPAPSTTAPGTVSTLTDVSSSAIIQPTIPDQPNPTESNQKETIQQEADRVRKENESEVYVSLH